MLSKGGYHDLIGITFVCECGELFFYYIGRTCYYTTAVVQYPLPLCRRIFIIFDVVVRELQIILPLFKAQKAEVHHCLRFFYLLLAFGTKSKDGYAGLRRT